MGRRTFTIRIPTRWLIPGLAVLLIGALIPTALAAGGTFTDDDTSIFEADIEWLAEAGVTKGCNPSEGNTRFCPEDEVTRGQMAAFMRRFAQFLGAEDGRVNTADWAQVAEEAVLADDAVHAGEAGSAGWADVAGEADNADLLDGKDSTEFLEHGAIVLVDDGSRWSQLGAVAVDLYNGPSHTVVDGGGHVVMPLTSPTIVGGMTYGLSEIEICFDAQGDAVVDWVEIYLPSGGGVPGMVLTDEDRGGPFCTDYPVGFALPWGTSIGVGISDPGGDNQVHLFSVRSTWTTQAAQP